MFATKATVTGRDGSRTRQRVSLQADTTPATLPTSGADVSNMANDVQFDTGSDLLDVQTGDVYLYGEDRAWHKLGEGA